LFTTGLVARVRLLAAVCAFVPLEVARPRSPVLAVGLAAREAALGLGARQRRVNVRVVVARASASVQYSEAPGACAHPRRREHIGASMSPALTHHPVTSVARREPDESIVNVPAAAVLGLIAMLMRRPIF
jgi:hypothetical protein